MLQEQRTNEGYSWGGAKTDYTNTRGDSKGGKGAKGKGGNKGGKDGGYNRNRHDSAHGSFSKPSGREGFGSMTQGREGFGTMQQQSGGRSHASSQQ